MRRAPAAKGQIFLVNLSGRGDKDVTFTAKIFQELDATDACHPHWTVCLQTCSETARKGLIAYLTAGDPAPERTPRWWRPWSAAAPTSSSWAFRFPIPSPMDR